VTATNLIVLLCTLVVVVGVAFAAYRWSLRAYAGLSLVASESNAAMQQAAAALRLEFVPSVSYEHPIVGRIASFGSLHGNIDGVQIRVEVRSDEAARGPTHFWTELRAERISEAPRSAPSVIAQEERTYRIQRDGPTLIMRPNLREAGSSQAYLYRVVTDAPALGRLVAELVALARSQSQVPP
jgi:hypothetical protein